MIPPPARTPSPAPVNDANAAPAPANPVNTVVSLPMPFAICKAIEAILIPLPKIQPQNEIVANVPKFSIKNNNGVLTVVKKVTMLSLIFLKVLPKF